MHPTSKQYLPNNNNNPPTKCGLPFTICFWSRSSILSWLWNAVNAANTNTCPTNPAAPWVFFSSAHAWCTLPSQKKPIGNVEVGLRVTYSTSNYHQLQSPYWQSLIPILSSSGTAQEFLIMFWLLVQRNAFAFLEPLTFLANQQRVNLPTDTFSAFLYRPGFVFICRNAKRQTGKTGSV